MDATTTYSAKAAYYARYRWEYAPAAIQALIEVAGLSPTSVVADVGAGTGILSRQLARQFSPRRIYVIEPNHAMRREARTTLAPHPCCTVLDGRAEAIPVPDASVDLIAVAQAIHWFEPAAARAEFQRIARPGAWLALLRNYGTDARLGTALKTLMVPENGVDTEHATRNAERLSLRAYFGPATPLTRTFPFVLHEAWETFLGSLCSASYTPDERHPRYPRFERAARAIFERLSADGLLTVRGETELVVGRV